MLIIFVTRPKIYVHPPEVSKYVLLISLFVCFYDFFFGKIEKSGRYKEYGARSSTASLAIHVVDIKCENVSLMRSGG